MDKVDRIFFNGNILTMDNQNTIVQAVALLKNTIYATGDNKTILSMASSETDCINLQGKTMLPGLYESHGHFQLASDGENNKVDLAAAPLGNMQTLDQCLRALKEYAQKNGINKPIYGYRYDNTGILEKRHLTKYDLDKVSTTRPVIVNHISNHLAYLNSKALKILNITKNTLDPEGGKIQKDPNTGEPNGILEENAIYLTPQSSLMIMSVDYQTEEERFEAWEKTTLQYAKLGVTTANDAVCYPETVLLYRKAIEKGYLKIRMSINPAFNFYEKIKNNDFAHPFLTIGGAKLFQDGSIQGYTAYLKEKYYIAPKNEENYHGYPTYPYEELRQKVKKAHQNGWQLVVHNCGDAGLEEYLEALEDVQNETPMLDNRHVALHCIVMKPEQLQRMKKLNMIAAFFVDHVYYWGDKHKNRFLGENRANYLCPMRSAIDAGLITTIHCDNPSGPEIPFLAIWSAVKRVTKDGEILGRDQSISVLEALRAYTIEAAYQFFEEDIKGSIETGKLADLIVVDRNPLTCPVDYLKDIEVEMTMVDGNIVYQKEKVKWLENFQI